MMACDNSNFKKSPVTVSVKPSDNAAVQKTREAPPAQTEDSEVEPSIAEELPVEDNAADPLPIPTSTPAPAPSAPVGAIVKGSFTVYTIPKNPRTLENYSIFIKIVLPPGQASTYKKEDLNIVVTGTDGYQNRFPSTIAMDPTKTFTIRGDEVTVVMRIPGAARLVKDSIRCQSKLLNENQLIELVFGAPAQL
jgi:hypothetical protein